MLVAIFGLCALSVLVCGDCTAPTCASTDGYDSIPVVVNATDAVSTFDVAHNSTAKVFVDLALVPLNATSVRLTGCAGEVLFVGTSSHRLTVAVGNMSCPASYLLSSTLSLSHSAITFEFSPGVGPSNVVACPGSYLRNTSLTVTGPGTDGVWLLGSTSYVAPFIVEDAPFLRCFKSRTSYRSVTLRNVTVTDPGASIKLAPYYGPTTLQDVKFSVNVSEAADPVLSSPLGYLANLVLENVSVHVDMSASTGDYTAVEIADGTSATVAVKNCSFTASVHPDHAMTLVEIDSPRGDWLFDSVSWNISHAPSISTPVHTAGNATRYVGMSVSSGDVKSWRMTRVSAAMPPAAAVPSRTFSSSIAIGFGGEFESDTAPSIAVASFVSNPPFAAHGTDFATVLVMEELQCPLVSLDLPDCGAKSAMAVKALAVPLDLTVVRLGTLVVESLRHYVLVSEYTGHLRLMNATIDHVDVQAAAEDCASCASTRAVSTTGGSIGDLTITVPQSTASVLLSGTTITGTLNLSGGDLTQAVSWSMHQCDVSKCVLQNTRGDHSMSLTDTTVSSFDASPTAAVRTVTLQRCVFTQDLHTPLVTSQALIESSKFHESLSLHLSSAATGIVRSLRIQHRLSVLAAGPIGGGYLGIDGITFAWNGTVPPVVEGVSNILVTAQPGDAVRFSGVSIRNNLITSTAQGSVGISVLPEGTAVASSSSSSSSSSSGTDGRVAVARKTWWTISANTITSLRGSGVSVAGMRIGSPTSDGFGDGDTISSLSVVLSGNRVVLSGDAVVLHGSTGTPVDVAVLQNTLDAHETALDIQLPSLTGATVAINTLRQTSSTGAVLRVDNVASLLHFGFSQNTVSSATNTSALNITAPLSSRLALKNNTLELNDQTLGAVGIQGGGDVSLLDNAVTAVATFAPGFAFYRSIAAPASMIARCNTQNGALVVAFSPASPTVLSCSSGCAAGECNFGAMEMPCNDDGSCRCRCPMGAIAPVTDIVGPAQCSSLTVYGVPAADCGTHTTTLSLEPLDCALDYRTSKQCVPWDGSGGVPPGDTNCVYLNTSVGVLTITACDTLQTLYVNQSDASSIVVGNGCDASTVHVIDAASPVTVEVQHAGLSTVSVCGTAPSTAVNVSFSSGGPKGTLQFHGDFGENTSVTSTGVAAVQLGPSAVVRSNVTVMFAGPVFSFDAGAVQRLSGTWDFQGSSAPLHFVGPTVEFEDAHIQIAKLSSSVSAVLNRSSLTVLQLSGFPSVTLRLNSSTFELLGGALGAIRLDRLSGGSAVLIQSTEVRDIDVALPPSDGSSSESMPNSTLRFRNLHLSKWPSTRLITGDLMGVVMAFDNVTMGEESTGLTDNPLVIRSISNGRLVFWGCTIMLVTKTELIGDKNLRSLAVENIRKTSVSFISCTVVIRHPENIALLSIAYNALSLSPVQLTNIHNGSFVSVAANLYLHKIRNRRPVSVLIDDVGSGAVVECHLSALTTEQSEGAMLSIEGMNGTSSVDVRLEMCGLLETSLRMTEGTVRAFALLRIHLNECADTILILRSLGHLSASVPAGTLEVSGHVRRVSAYYVHSIAHIDVHDVVAREPLSWYYVERFETFSMVSIDASASPTSAVNVWGKDGEEIVLRNISASAIHVSRSENVANVQILDCTLNLYFSVGVDVDHISSSAPMVLRISGCTITATRDDSSRMVWIDDVAAPRSVIVVENNTVASHPLMRHYNDPTFGIQVGPKSYFTPPTSKLSDRALVIIRDNSVSVRLRGDATSLHGGIGISGVECKHVVLLRNVVNVTSEFEIISGTAVGFVNMVEYGGTVNIVDNVLRVGTSSRALHNSSFVNVETSTGCANFSLFLARNVLAPAVNETTESQMALANVTFVRMPLSATCSLTSNQDTFTHGNWSSPIEQLPSVINITSGDYVAGTVRIRESTVEAQGMDARLLNSTDVWPAVFVPRDVCVFGDHCGPATVSVARCFTGPDTPPLCKCRCPDGNVTIANGVPLLQCTPYEPTNNTYQCVRASDTVSLTASLSLEPPKTDTSAATRTALPSPTVTRPPTVTRAGTPTQVPPRSPSRSSSRSVTLPVSTSRRLSATATLAHTRSPSAFVSTTKPPLSTPSVSLPRTSTTSVHATLSLSDVGKSVSMTHEKTMHEKTMSSTPMTTVSVTLRGTVSSAHTVSFRQTETAAVPPIPTGPASVPLLYRVPGAQGLLFSIVRGAGVSSQRPLSLSLQAAAGSTPFVIGLSVARTTVSSLADSSSALLNGVAFSANRTVGNETNVCGSMKAASSSTGNPVLFTPSLRIEAGPAHQVSCHPSVFFSGVVTLRSFSSAPFLQRGVSVSVVSVQGFGSNVTGQPDERIPVRLQATDGVVAATAHVFHRTGTSATGGAIRIGPHNGTATFDALRCSAGDMDAFEATPHRVGSGVVIACRTASGDACQTLVDFHSACSDNSQCAGVTAAVGIVDGDRNELVEVPVTMHAITNDNAVSDSVPSTDEELLVIRDRLIDRYPTIGGVTAAAFYRRVPSEDRACRVAVNGHGRVRVLLQQTSLAEDAIDVFVKSSGFDFRRGRCGGADLFTQLQPGQSGVCDLFLECVEVKVSPGDVVSVIPQGGVNQFGCNESLGALLLFTEETPSHTPSPGGPPPFEGHNVSGFTKRSIGAAAAIVDNAAVPALRFTIITVAARNVTLRVAQTRFACSAANDGSCPFDAAVTMSTGPGKATAVSCAGAAGFPQLGQAPHGFTGQCQVALDCSRDLVAPQPAAAVNGDLWAQRTTVSVDPALLRAAPVSTSGADSLCGGFRADLLIDDGNTKTAVGSSGGRGAPLFPLWCDAFGTTLCPAVLIPAAAASQAASNGRLALAEATLEAVLHNASDHPSIIAQSRPLLISTLVDAQNEPQIPSFVEWDMLKEEVKSNDTETVTALSASPLLSSLAPSAVYACLMDTAPLSGQVRCSIPIPASTTAAAVDVLQTDFAEKSIDVAFVSADGSTVEKTTCGGPELFLGQRGSASQCDVFLPCRVGFIPNARLDLNDSRRPTSIVITVPALLASGPCEWALAATVTFSSQRAPPSCTAGTEFTCASDASCVPRAAVCDGIPNDCSDNSDEAQCRFTLVDRGTTPLPSIITVTLPGVTEYTECLRETVLRRGRAFFLDTATGCAVVNSTNAAALVSDPQRWTTGQTEGGGRGELHVATPLVTPRSQYRHCTAALHCSDRGVITDATTCACRCLTSYTGPHCETLVQSGVVVSYVALVARSIAQPHNASALPLNVLAGALAPSHLFPSVKITAVGQPLSYDDDHVAFPFVADSEDRAGLAAYLARIFTPATTAAVNDLLRPATKSNNTVRLIFGVDAPNMLHPIGHCSSVLANGTVGGCPAPPFTQGTLLLTATGLSQLSLSVASGTGVTTKVSRAAHLLADGDGQSTDGQASTLQCSGASVSYGDTTPIARCRPSTCVLSTGGASVDPTRALRVRAVPDDGCDAPTLAISTSPRIKETPVVAPPKSEVSLSATEAFIFAGAGTAVAALIVVVGAAAASVIFTRALREAASSISERGSRRVAWGLARESLARFCGRESIIAAAITIFVIVAVCAGFFGVLHVHSKIWGSNTAVMIELYETSECGGQRLKTLPATLITIEATSRCQPVVITGQSPGPLFAAAECVDGSDGARVPRLRIARSLDECREGEGFTDVGTSVCTDASTFLPQLRYMVAACVTKVVAAERGETIVRYNPVAPLLDQVPVTHDHMNTTRRIPAELNAGDSLFRSTFQVGFSEAHSTSHELGSVATVATVGAFTGGYEARRLLVQDGDAFRPAAAHTTVSTTEQRYQPNLTRLDARSADLASLVPNDGDYPVGFVFSGFGSSSEISGDAAGLGAQRYRGVRETAFDVGHQFEPDPTDVDLAVSVSFWMRATTTSQGFVFAVTDDYEDTHDRLSPLMTRLRKVALSGTGGGVPWFNDTWHAYAALFVDGASQSLTLVYADPADDVGRTSDAKSFGSGDDEVEGDKVVRAQWSLPSMGEASLFNGAWHKVSIALRNDEGRFFAVIAVDGRSSLSSSHWRKCLPRRPRPIVSSLSKDGRAVNVSRANRASVSDGGVMYVGHFNGAVRGLRVERSSRSAAADVRSGTRAMRIHAAVPHRTGIEATAVALFVSAFVTAIYVAFQAVVIAIKSRAAATLMDERAEEEFEGKAETLFTSAYPAVPFRSCMAWLDISARSLVQLCGELAASPVDAEGRVKLVLALWQARHDVDSTADAPAADTESTSSDGSSAASKKVSYPSPQAWAAFLVAEGVTMESDEALLRRQRRRSDGRHELEAGKVAGETRTTFGNRSNTTAAQGDRPASRSAPTDSALAEKLPGGAPSVDSFNGDQVSTILLTAVGTLQAAAVYFGGFVSVPDLYTATVGALFGFLTLSFDFFGSLIADPLAGAMAQAVAVVALLVAVACVMANDDRRFYGIALRYQVRRDTLQLLVEDNEEIAEITAEGQRMLAQVDPFFDPAQCTAPFSELHSVHILPPEDRCAVASLLENGSTGESVTVAARDGRAVVTVVNEPLGCFTTTALRAAPCDVDGTDSDGGMSPHVSPLLGVEADDVLGGRPVAEAADLDSEDSSVDEHQQLEDSGGAETSARDPSAGKQLETRVSVGSKSPPAAGERPHAACGEKVRDLGFSCIRHDRSWLSQTTYTDVYPFSRRRRCCAVVDGTPCGHDLGDMYCCPESECGFALCAAHVRLDGAMGLFLHVWSQVARFTANGPIWLIEFVVITLAIALYTPALRTCVMIVGCHPVYQCEFGDCWSYPTQRFAAAAYLAIVIIVLYGVMFPLALMALLYVRFRTLHRLFARPSYRGRYMQPIPAEDTPSNNAELQQRSAVLWLSYAVERVTAAVKRLWVLAWAKVRRAPMEDTTTEGPVDLLDCGGVDSVRARFAQRWTFADVAPSDVPPSVMDESFAPHTEAQPNPLIPPFDYSASAMNPPALSPWQQRVQARLSVSMLNRTTAAAAQEMATSAAASGGERPSCADPNASSLFSGSASGRPLTRSGTPMANRLSWSAGGSPKSLRLRSLVKDAVALRDTATPESPRVVTTPRVSVRGRPNGSAVGEASGQPNEVRTGTEGAPPAAHGNSVDTKEWQRFLIADQSVIAKLYASVPVERLAAVVVLTIARFLLLVPPLLLEPSSATQFAFIAAGEITFAAGFVISQPFVSPWVTVTTLAGSVHQFIIVGLQALLTARANDADLAPVIGVLMMGTTTGYIAFVVIVLGAVLAYGFVAEIIAESRSDGFFERFKISRPTVQPIFLCPTNGAGQGPVETYAVEDSPVV